MRAGQGIKRQNVFDTRITAHPSDRFALDSLAAVGGPSRQP